MAVTAPNGRVLFEIIEIRDSKSYLRDLIDQNNGSVDQYQNDSIA